MTPIPPLKAIVMAVCDSVTVSIAAEINGMESRTLSVSRVFRSTSPGNTVLWRGTNNTSSKVSANGKSDCSILPPTMVLGAMLTGPRSQRKAPARHFIVAQRFTLDRRLGTRSM